MSFRQLTLKKIHYLPYHLHPIPSGVNEQLKIFFLPVPMLLKYKNTQFLFYLSAGRFLSLHPFYR